MARFSFSLLSLSLLACLTAASNFDVTVGKDGQLKFVPETLNAYPGDTVTYHFFSKNHSVVQSTFDAPCQQSGFFSGFTPATATDLEAPTTFQITVNDTKPIWVFCGQTGHCQKGMVHAINA
jgi:plastocyanin